MCIIIIMYSVHPVATLKWFTLLVAIFLSSVVLDVEATFEPVDDLEGQKYFVAEPAVIKLNETKIGSNDTVVIATYNQTSRLQCRHRCNHFQRRHFCSPQCKGWFHNMVFCLCFFQKNKFLPFHLLSSNGYRGTEKIWHKTITSDFEVEEDITPV